MPLISRRLHADLDTPVSAYLKLSAASPWSFLFESVEGAEVWAAYSIIGVGARRTFVHQAGNLAVRGASTQNLAEPDALRALRAALQKTPLEKVDGAPRFVGGVFGFLSYDAVRAFEPIGREPSAAEVPDACFVEPEIVAVFDNRAHSLTVYAWDQEALDGAVRLLRGPLPAHPSRHALRRPHWSEAVAESGEQFMEAVRQAKEHIRAGDIIQVVLSRRFDLPPVADPFDVYRGLRAINPSPYLYYYRTPELALAGASPEVMIRVGAGEVIVRPIAGTRRRGETPEEDARLSEELLADAKERAEHIMLVDLGRNDVGRVSAPGTVQVPALMVIERYSHVMHIVSEVRGTLAPGLDAFDALRAAFPAGTLSGAPKVRAMQIIDSLERRRRGIYGGAVGYFGPDGDADFGIAIRTLVARSSGLTVQAGAGIVADSDPAAELAETEHKARAVLRAAEWAASDEAPW